MTRKMYQFLMMAALSGVMLSDNFRVGGRSMKSHRRELSKAEREALDQKREVFLNKLKLKRGLRTFSFEGVEIIALNQVNAERKYKKIKQQIESFK